MLPEFQRVESYFFSADNCLAISSTSLGLSCESTLSTMLAMEAESAVATATVGAGVSGWGAAGGSGR